MPDKIVLQKYYGDVIQVDGKCWQFVGFDDAQVTHTSGDVSALFASCEDCIVDLNPIIVPPSGLSQSLGDVHYVYGDPDTIALDPTMSSFNVDDNISTNEIVWWTHTEGGVEYVIKYTQQEFTYTSGGLSIDQIVVSASDLSVNDTYTLTDPQSATLRNGGAWSNGGVSGLGTAISYNITERIIENADCSLALGVSSHFGLFNLEVSPNSGFYNMDENGGALWYVWKQLATAYGAGAVNNPSSANFDGLGTFLSGINGYNARSQFETTPSSVRETFDSPTALAIIDKLKELSSIDGSWNADWDPLAQTPINCPPIPEIPEYVCGGATQGVSHNGRRFLGAFESSSNQWSAIKAKLDDPNYVPVNLGGIGLVGMKNFISTGSSTSMLISYRTYTTLHTIAEPLFMRCIFRTNELNREFVILWTTDPEPAVNNHGYDRASWNLLGTVKNESSLTQTKDVDLAPIGKPSYVRIVVTTINDYLNDSINGTPLEGNNPYQLQSEEVRRCL